MTDLEQRIRDLMDDDARSAPPPHDAAPALRRTRRRQALTVAGAAFGAVALAAASIVGVRAVLSSDGATIADGPTVTTTMNGVSITYPEGWHVIDPDEAGLNGPEGPPDEIPRLILALSPIDNVEQFGCPGLVEGTMPTFLMTVQEEPLALTGPDTTAWPVSLEPLVAESAEAAETANAESAEGGCYPGWEFLRAGWTASGRTFEARVGLAPEIGDGDRDALFAAFASMSFDPAEGPGAVQAVLDEGVIGGETWQLVAKRDDGGFQLAIDTPDSSSGMAGFSMEPGELQWAEQRIGAGSDERVLLFGALPKGVVRLEAAGGDEPSYLSVLQVPNEISNRFDAFVVVMEPGGSTSLAAVTAEGEVVATAVVAAGTGDPVEAPLPQVPAQMLPVHGGVSWGLYLAVSATLDDPSIDEAIRSAETLGYTAGGGEIACDQPAAGELGVPEESFAVAIYFATREEAQAAAALFDPVGIARVTTFCLD